MSAKRCDAYARKGIGIGVCNRPLDEHGYCDRASDHLPMAPQLHPANAVDLLAVLDMRKCIEEGHSWDEVKIVVWHRDGPGREGVKQLRESKACKGCLAVKYTIVTYPQMNIVSEAIAYPEHDGPDAGMEVDS